MNLTPRPYLSLLLTGSLFALSGSDLHVSAQPKKAGPSLVSPQAPTIAFPSNSGAMRGSTIELSMTGTNLAAPIGAWTSFPAKVTFPTDANNGNEAGKLRIKIDVAADAPIGLHTVRIATKRGISNAQVFCVDEMPQVAEVETNQAKSTAQPITIPCVVMGRADVERSDFFRISIKPGQRLTFEVLGRRLGSAIDPLIKLYDAATGRDVPSLFSDDAPGLQTDARLTHTFKEGGDFLVEVRDTTYRGGPDYLYRLRIGDFPAAIAAVPIAIKRGAKAQVRFAGPAVEGVIPVEVAAPAEPDRTVVYAAPKWPGSLSGWPVPVFVSDIDERVESEPNNEMATANRLSVPSGVTGRFLEKGDIDMFVFAAKKGKKYSIMAETYEINSPTEIYLILKNAKNAELGKSVPASQSSRIEYAAAEDADLYVHAEQLNYAHGPNEVYHLSIRAVEPDFDVVLGVDQVEVAPGGTTLVPVTGVVRRNYAGPIELSVTGLPGVLGSVTIPAGVPAPNPPAGQPIAYLPLTVKADVPMGALAFAVLAKATIDGKEVDHLAVVTDIVKQRMGNLEILPREMLTSIGLGITDKPLVLLAAAMPHPEVIAGKSTVMTLIAQRATGFSEEIAIAAVNPPAGVTVATKSFGKGSNSVDVQVTAGASVPAGTYPLFFRQSIKSAGKEMVYSSGPFEILVVADKKEIKTDKKDQKKK